ncbi:Hsp20/alpha crystallin family protein [Mucilaginibacter hurinus]|uniref:Hsp20/alpha crystallin family protein n=1 Tax=Mucilaginibacter hurinus TaxID=2201324 RepID=A0A367GJF9_9SPHI|nr:Hsp20/alpha crystallin family protein [Mucilaginibacter hurinus]RCH53607.1 Hsp20/alpha crystallin family protein [Mucilaginibacter hurinus]
MSLIKFNSDRKNNALMPGFNDVFESFFNDTLFSDRLITRVPAVNISETTDAYSIELAAPGLKKEDFKINMNDRVLTVSVEQHHEHQANEKKYSKREYSYASFVRSFTLPDGADEAGIEATYNDGVLMVTIPKKEEAKSVSRQIEIK